VVAFYLLNNLRSTLTLGRKFSGSTVFLGIARRVLYRVYT